MSTVIITEKPDVALAIAKALTEYYKQCEGYIMGNNGLLITWTQGHLLTIKEPGEIKAEWEDWSWDTLPILPPYLALKPLPNSQKQLDVIYEISKNCHLLVNALDAGAEGEVIYFYVAKFLNLADVPTKRLWTASLQPAAIKKAFEEMKDNNEYKHLRNAGVARSLGDYILGINCTRSLTLAGGGNTLAAGRVQSLVLALIYDRQIAREDFEEEVYYTIKAFFRQEKVLYDANYKGERLTDIEEVKRISQLIKRKQGDVKYVDETKYQHPPLLPNLTDITVKANQRLGFKVIETTKILQSLYLKGVITYPRTNSRYVSNAELSLLHKSYQVLKDVFPIYCRGNDINIVNINNKRIFNPQEIQDHHAILPEAVIPTNLTKEEDMVYQLIVELFFLQFQTPMKYISRKVTTIVEGYTFQNTFKEVLDYGWKGLNLDIEKECKDDEEQDDDDENEEIVNELPELQKSLSVENVEIVVKERKTSAPTLYTEGSLMKQMENVGNIIKDKRYKAALKGCGIGTSATRAETIQKLQDNGYVTSKKKKLEVTKLGKTVTKMIRNSPSNLLTSPELTAQWELELEEIKNGKNMKTFLESIVSFTTNFVEEMQGLSLPDEALSTLGTKCPYCDSLIKSNTKVYYCKSDCSFFIWKKQYSKSITQKMLDDLITKGETNLLTFTTKDGKRKYKARLKLPNPLENGKLQIAYL